MATGQLIPDWQHPSETTFIYDNTVITDTESMNTEAITLLTVFTGPKGRDNKLLKKNSLYAHVEEYGYPDYKKYGQAGYIPYTAMSTGNAMCWEMRVMPEDASYGNVFYTVKYKSVTEESTDAEDTIAAPVYREISFGTDNVNIVKTSEIKYIRFSRIGEIYNSILIREDGTTYLYNSVTGAEDEFEIDEKAVTFYNKSGNTVIEMKDVKYIPVSAVGTYEAVILEGDTYYLYDPKTEAKGDEVTPNIDSPKTTKTRMYVKFEAQKINALNDGNLFEEYMKLAESDTEDREGYKVVPYIGFRMLGRGEYGKYFRVRLSRDTSTDRENKYVNYVVSLISTEFGTVQKETFPAVTFIEDGVDPRTNVTNYVTEVVNDYEGDGSKRMTMVFFPDSHEKLYKFYKENIDPNTELTLENFDIFGYDKLNATDNPYIEVEGGINSIDLFDITGVKFDGGSDGSLDVTTYSEEERNATAMNLYARAFNGEFDTRINSVLRAPCNICLDANYSETVKKAMVALTTTRKDMLCYLDSGLLTTVRQIKDYFKNTFEDIANYYTSKNCGMFVTRDAVSGRRIPVTITLWLAYKIPMHWRQRGLYTAMAGEDYATLSGYVRNSIKPEIDADDHETKEYLYKARINYIECLSEDTFIRGTQQTSQKELSDLSEENNVHVMLQVKRRLERLCAQKRYHLGEAAERKLFTDDANDLFSSWKGTYMRDIKISFSMNRYEELRSILHCTCEIIFNTLVKRSVIEININPRA